MQVVGKSLFGAMALIAGIGLAGTASAQLEFDQDVTPDVIFGSGNDNGGFTTDRNSGVEIGLRGKLRFNASGLPENTFNSNGDGTYSFQNIVGPGQTTPTPEWAFEWSVNTDFEDATGTVLADLTYELGLDGDPGLGTNFLTFDPINVDCADHALGTNATGHNAGTVFNCPADATDYVAELAVANVAQNSWRYDFFTVPLTPLAGFDPTEVGVYDIYLLAKDTNGHVVARSDIRILVGVDLPLDKDECKKGGWMTFEPPFKNQGDCVSFVNTGK